MSCRHPYKNRRVFLRGLARRRHPYCDRPLSLGGPGKPDTHGRCAPLLSPQPSWIRHPLAPRWVFRRKPGCHRHPQFLRFLSGAILLPTAKPVAPPLSHPTIMITTPASLPSGTFERSHSAPLPISGALLSSGAINPPTPSDLPPHYFSPGRSNADTHRRRAGHF